MSNFDYLNSKKRYQMFAASAIEAERVYSSSPAMCAVGCRKALELAVKWVYSADSMIFWPYRDNLTTLINEPSFRDAVDATTWSKLIIVVKLGNRAVHTDKRVSRDEALISLKILFEFIQWIDYCYGREYEDRVFDESLIPAEKMQLDTARIKEQESLLGEKDAEIERLRKQVEALSPEFTAEKDKPKDDREFTQDDLSEYKTRKLYIDIDLKDLGWEFDGYSQNVREEYEISDMTGVIGQKGFVDYVLMGKDGLPLAVIEAKRTSKDPNIGRHQAVLYADALERKFGRRPFIFNSNGFNTFFWDDKDSPQRRVSGFSSRDDLQKIMNRREEKKPLNTIPISDEITGRYYQKEAIRAVCDAISEGTRKHLLVMATGTGKTRTAASLTDVLSRGGYVTNVLFLADRTALVKQAKDAFKSYLPEMSLCNLCSNKDDRNARIVFSTYPTILNAISREHTSDGIPLFTPTHFDLIIIDESHRSIFKKYRAIFDYFDSMLVGLTATPKMDVDKNTYEFFEMEHNVPTYAYDYETAVDKDHVLVPYYSYEVKMKFAEDGIVYDDLPEDEKAKYEDDFAEDDGLPDLIPSSKLNKFVFNENTVDTVIQDLMENGIRIKGGDELGKTIIFAQNKHHAEFIIERFNHLYPQYHGKFAQRVICDDTYTQDIIDRFKTRDGDPQIAVSVDMMDTGIDVPDCVNLVFFKKVMSKTKFWQMIGRGTRLAPDVSFVDRIEGEYTDKKRFIIFDYCGNFEFFRENPNGFEGNAIKSLSESIYEKKVRIISGLQDAAFNEDAYRDYRNKLVSECHQDIRKLNTKLVTVRLVREYVVKFSEITAFDFISEGDKNELITKIAPVVVNEDEDEYAKRFDNLMYGIIVSCIEGIPGFNRGKNQVMKVGTALQGKHTIPQVNAKMTLIKQVSDDAFWDSKDVLAFETVRAELRDLIKFLDYGKTPIIITDLTDPILDIKAGETLPPAYDFEDYKKKVNRYVEENGNTMAIYKITHNIQLSSGDYNELERVLTSELGSREDYAREYGDTPFGLLIRKIAKLDHDAAMAAFSDFINDESLNQRQIAFVHKIITHIENNGYMESVKELQKPPFDKPVAFVKMFNKDQQIAIMNTINGIRDNAIVISA